MENRWTLACQLTSDSLLMGGVFLRKLLVQGYGPPHEPVNIYNPNGGCHRKRSNTSIRNRVFNIHVLE